MQAFLQRAQEQVEDLQQETKHLHSQLTNARAAELQARQMAGEKGAGYGTEIAELQHQLVEARREVDENQDLWTEKLREMQKVNMPLSLVLQRSSIVLLLINTESCSCPSRGIPCRTGVFQ